VRALDNLGDDNKLVLRKELLVFFGEGDSLERLAFFELNVDKP